MQAKGGAQRRGRRCLLAHTVEVGKWRLIAVADPHNALHAHTSRAHTSRGVQCDDRAMAVQGDHGAVDPVKACSQLRQARKSDCLLCGHCTIITAC
jgi:hypothetical protein